MAACTNGASENPAANPAGVIVNDETGGVEGLIVNDALSPIPDVVVLLDGQATATVTAADGRFALSLVKPGTHDLTFVHAAHAEKSMKVEVKAGEVSNVQTELIPLASQDAYVRIDQNAGFITCSAGIKDPVLAPDGRGYAAICAAVDFFGGTSLDRAWIRYERESFQDIVDIFGESTWDSTQALGTGLLVIWWLEHPDFHTDECACGWQANWSAGADPVQLQMPISRIDEIVKEEGEANTLSCREIDGCLIDVLHYAFPQTAPSSPIDVGVVIDQKFDVYRSTFFHDPMPLGYSALADS